MKWLLSRGRRARRQDVGEKGAGTSVGQVGARRPSRPKVLIADDDDMVLNLAGAALQRSGFDVLSAVDGVQAEELLAAHQPAVAVLDWDMPRRSGIDVCEGLKNRRSGRPRVVMLTAVTGEDSVARGFGAGADEYITKPFDPRELVRVVTLLAESESSASADDGPTGETGSGGSR